MRECLIVRPLCAVFVSGLLSVSCATTDDPRQGGLISGMHSIGTGAYDKRIEEREARLQRLREMQQELKSEQQQLETDRSERQARLDELEGRLKRLDAESRQLLTELQTNRAHLAENRSRQARLEQDLTALRSAIADLDRKRDSDISVAALESERDRLEEEYRLLLDLYLELGK